MQHAAISQRASVTLPDPVAGFGPRVSMRPIILLIDNDQSAVNLLEWSLRSAGCEVVSARNGPEGIATLERIHPNLVIMDVDLPGLDGFETCIRIRAFSKVPLVFVTSRRENADIVRGLNLGADDYVVKPFVVDELLARVSVLLRRAGHGVPAERLSSGDLEMVPGSAEVTRRQAPVHLTRAEFRLLRYFMTRPDTVCSRDEIRRAMWGLASHHTLSSVEVLISRLRRRLGSPPIILTVRGAGYVLRTPRAARS